MPEALSASFDTATALAEEVSPLHMVVTLREGRCDVDMHVSEYCDGPMFTISSLPRGQEPPSTFATDNPDLLGIPATDEDYAHRDVVVLAHHDRYPGVRKDMDVFSVSSFDDLVENLKRRRADIDYFGPEVEERDIQFGRSLRSRFGHDSWVSYLDRDERSRREFLVDQGAPDDRLDSVSLVVEGILLKEGHPDFLEKFRGKS